MPAAQSPVDSNDHSALIGGIVGGAVALILLGALIAFCVVRSRRQTKNNGTSVLQVNAPSESESNYGFSEPPRHAYDKAPVMPRVPTAHHYEEASSSMQY
jgi:hypothetical protein